jgi:hypothetical protein
MNTTRFATGDAADSQQRVLDARDPRRKERGIERLRECFRQRGVRSLTERMVWFHIFDRCGLNTIPWKEMFSEELERTQMTFETFRHDPWGYYFDAEKHENPWGPHGLDGQGDVNGHVELLQRLSTEVR